MSDPRKALERLHVALRQALLAFPLPGTHAAIASGLDAYHAVNLREALKLVPDTGDWHGSLRAACEIVLRDNPNIGPNVTAAEMLTRMERP